MVAEKKLSLAEYEYGKDHSVVRKRMAIMSNFRPYNKTISYNRNGSIQSIEITHPDGALHNKTVFEYKATNPYTVRAVIFEAYENNHCIQRRTSILDVQQEDCVREKNEFFDTRVGKHKRDFVCEETYNNAYIDKLGSVRDCRTKEMIFK